MQKIATGIALTILLGTMFLGLFNMSNTMDMHHGESDCMYMIHDNTICPMDLADHIAAWQATFLAIAPTIALLLSLAVVVVLIASIAPHLLQPGDKSIPIARGQLRERTYTYSYRSLQEMFAKGILHPKVF